MFKKSLRVNRKTFDEIWKSGKIVSSDFLYVKFLESSGVKRFSTVIPKKVLNKAFARNKLKRQVNAILKELNSEIPDGSYLFFVKNELVGLPFGQVKEKISEIIGKLAK